MSSIVNLHRQWIWVRHSELERFSEDSDFRSDCRACKNGLLHVRRIGEFGTGDLHRVDYCTTCGQHYVYTDDEIAGVRLTPSLDECLVMEIMIA